MTAGTIDQWWLLVTYFRFFAEQFFTHILYYYARVLVAMVMTFLIGTVSDTVLSEGVFMTTGMMTVFRNNFAYCIRVFLVYDDDDHHDHHHNSEQFLILFLKWLRGHSHWGSCGPPRAIFELRESCNAGNSQTCVSLSSGALVNRTNRLRRAVVKQGVLETSLGGGTQKQNKKYSRRT